jgi:trimethylamine--corrinoid protein Co-methyltransferase
MAIPVVFSPPIAPREVSPMTARIDPIAPQLHWDVLSQDDVERIHEATLRVLANTGVRFPSAHALDVLERNGCRVDRATSVARFPAAVVAEAVGWAPREYVLAGRDAAADVVLDGRRSYLSNDASGVFVRDPHSSELRPSTKQDVAQSARFIDALPELSFCWGPVVTSQDAPVPARALHDAEAVLTSTSKHFQTVTTVGEQPARYLVEMAAVLAGGRLELRRRPLVSFMQCAVDPLAHDGPNLEANLVAAEAGLPAGFMPMPLAAGTGPATLAGTLVVHNAATLSGLVLLQLAAPGTPVFFAGAPSVIDVQTGAYTGGSPEDYLLAAAATQLAHHYGLPIAMGTMATGAKEPDWQAAVDDALSTFASVMTRADMMNGAGLLNGSKILSYPHIVLETEIYRIVKRMAGGIDVNDETLAVDVIARVGHGGTYLSEKHTRRNRPGIWRPRVWDRTPYDAWLRDGRRGALARATDVADEILQTYEPAPLPADLAAELRAIVTHADAFLTGAKR